jgi:hypothetical protein
MANTLKDLAASVKLVSEVGLEQALTQLKSYIDTNDTNINNKIDSLIGAQGGDADKIINTFNEIKDFLADYTEDDTLKSLIDAVNNAVTAEANRATAAEQAEAQRAAAAEQALGGRITTLENIHVMTAQEAQDIFDEIYGD